MIMGALLPLPTRSVLLQVVFVVLIDCSEEVVQRDPMRSWLSESTIRNGISVISGTSCSKCDAEHSSRP